MSSERAAWGASLGAIAGYALAILTSFPIRILYYPHSDSWSTVDLPGQVPIRWYGSMINAALGAAVGILVTVPLRMRPRWGVVWVLALAVLVTLGLHEARWFAR